MKFEFHSASGQSFLKAIIETEEENKDLEPKAHTLY